MQFRDGDVMQDYVLLHPYEQLLLMVLYIWTVELYSLMQNTMFINLLFDGLVVIAYIRQRIKMRASPKKTKQVSAQAQNGNQFDRYPIRGRWVLEKAGVLGQSYTERWR